VSDPAACFWCGDAFEPHRGGSRQTFCKAACRASFHREARRWCEREIAEGRLTVESLRTAAYTPPGGAKTLLSGQSDMGPPNSALIEPMASFRIEVSLYAIEMLVGSGWLDGDQQDDLFAIIAALKRLGRAPSALRIA
jgi:hypothetical protein